MHSMSQTEQIHATAIAIDGRGVLLLGDSGAGKSDLALRLIDRGARLVADDRVDLAREDASVMLSAPPRLAGLLEIRGVGIVRVDPLADVPLALAVRLVPRQSVERLPEDATHEFLGLAVPSIALDPFELSAPIKVKWALARVVSRTQIVA
jgi:serine kinase of HPr protein (carbohydrate metabolism regulator)